MALPTPDTQAKVASEAAEIFVDHFYDALSHRRPLGAFYASASPRLAAAGVKPDISVNGLAVADVPAYEALLGAQGGPVSYEVSSFDAQAVNPRFRVGEPEGGSGAVSGGGENGGGAPSGRDATAAAATLRSGDRISFAVQVSGVARYGRGRADAGAGNGGAAPASNGGAPGAAGIFGGAKADGGGGVLEKPFNEAFLLVPHWEAWARNAPRGLRKWVIVSQNFRAL